MWAGACRRGRSVINSHGEISLFAEVHDSVTESMMRYFLSLTCIIGLLAAAPAIAAVHAHVDRPVVSETETFRLTIEVSGQGTTAEPDLSVLRGDFDILGTGKSTHVSITNGRMDARTEWVVNLAPRRRGELTIPPLPIGSEATAPITIQVKETLQRDSEGGSRDVILETEVDDAEPYVLGQVVYTVRLLYSSEVASGQLSDPESDGAVIHRLGKDVRYQASRDGRPYWTLERRYAAFPQTGGEVHIRSPIFSGDIPFKNRGQSSRFDAFSGFDRFFQQTRPIRERGEDVTLHVRLPPASVRGRDWLPAKHLALTEAWQPDPPRFRVGEPVTRQVIITGWGTDDGQLPALDMPGDQAYKAYPEKDIRDSREQDMNLVSRRVQRVTLVPTKEGEFTLPQLEVLWWNTAEDREEVATLPARTVDVLPQAASGKVAASGAPGSGWRASLAGQDPVEPEWPTAKLDQGVAWPRLSDLWPWLAGGLLFAWLATLWLWRRERHAGIRPGPRVGHASIGPEEPEALSERAARHALDQACRADDARAARDAVLAWATAVWHAAAPNTLVELSERFKHPPAHAAIALLDRVIYTRNEAGWDGRRFWEAVSPALRKPEKRRHKSEEHALPELSPRL